MRTDRNLLFAVLAFQMDYITLRQLTTACRVWAANRTKPIAEVLLQQGWIESLDQAEIERHVERRMKKYGGSAQATLATVIDDQVRGAVREAGDADLERTVVELPAPVGHVLVETIQYRSETTSRYTLTKLHAEGGLGRVWLARDADLNREVALKELLPDRAKNSDAGRRFLKEAQVTGQLEHPNIVPVYELSYRPSDGQPFYTMRFVRGHTLNAAIAQYHETKPSERFDTLELRRLLGAFVAVCNAIAYAHSRHVVHRDLKPENIILGSFGEVMVLDWGLAKLVGQDDGERSAIEIAGDARIDATSAGTRLGTPAYMAPEQAEGRIDLIDARTDIYGLGAVLFKILTGKRPHTGESTAELLQSISSGHVPTPRKLDPAVPAALDAICACAMANKRTDRYATATALADDVQRWLADEPVSAYVEPWVQRLARWSRKHRAWTRAAAASLLAVAGVSVVAALLVENARRKAEAARHAEATAKTAAQRAHQAETKAHAEAVRHFQQAREAVDKHLTGVSQVLRYYPGVQTVRERLLREAAADYEVFAKTQSDDPRLQVEFARAYMRLGDVRATLAELSAAEHAYRQAESLLGRLATHSPDSVSLAIDRANNRTKLGTVVRQQGRLDDARLEYLAAIFYLEPFATTPSRNAAVDEALATTQLNLSLLLHAVGQRAEAEAVVERSIEILSRLAETHTEPRFRFNLASALSTHGQMLGARAMNRQAVALLQRAAGDFESLVRTDRNNPDYVEAAANTRMLLASSLMALGLDDDEIATYRAEIATYEELIDALPDVPRYRELLGMAEHNLGQLLRRCQRNAEAVSHLDAAHREFARLVQDHPAVPQYFEELAANLTARGQALSNLGRNDEALKLLELAVAACQELTARYENAEYAERLAVCLAEQGGLMHKLGDHASARERFDQSIGLLRDLCQADRGDSHRRDNLADVLTRLGDLLTEMGQADDAGEPYREAIALRKELTRLDEPQFDHALSWLLSTCKDERLRDATLAVEAAQRAADQTPDSATYRIGLALAHYRSGQWQESRQAAERALELRPGGDCTIEFLLALAYGQMGQMADAAKHYQRGRDWMQINCPEAAEARRWAGEARAVAKAQ